MKKRGPDYQNYVTHNFENKVSVMLHSRLSIIDKKKISNQPMEDGNGILSFNGEIYNYLEIKKIQILINLRLILTLRYCSNIFQKIEIYLKMI